MNGNVFNIGLDWHHLLPHIIPLERGNQYRSPNDQSGPDSDVEDESDDEEQVISNHRNANSIWQRTNCHNYTHNDAFKDTDLPSDNFLQHDFLRKYTHFAKTRIKPVLTDEARESIASHYAEMRSRQDEQTLPVTGRS